MLQAARVLIVEAEFLIALEIQRIVEESGAANAVAARSVAEALSLAPQWENFDLAIIEGRLGHAAVRAMVAQLRDAGLAVVITTADRNAASPIEGVVLVDKPFGEPALLSACVEALALTRQR